MYKVIVKEKVMSSVNTSQNGKFPLLGTNQIRILKESSNLKWSSINKQLFRGQCSENVNGGGPLLPVVK
jgi:hypothetical protein